MKLAASILTFLLCYSLYGQSITDTLYSDQVISYTSVSGFDLEGAEVSFTLNDTINNTFELISLGITDEFGEYVIDSLPVLNHISGLEKSSTTESKSNILITNSGSGSNHLFRILGSK